MANTKFKINIMQIIGIVCLALMIALFVTQFLPFWTVGEDNTTVSVMQYTAFPNDAAYGKTFIKDMKTQLVDAGLMNAKNNALKKLAINDFIHPAAILVLLSIFGFIACPFKLGKPLGIAFNLAVGITGIYMYLHHPIYQLGQNWIIGLVIAGALTALAAANAVIYIVKKSKE